MSWKSPFRFRKDPPAAFNTPAAPGLYPYLHEQEGEKARIHLRIDQDGSGLLLVNASRVMHLNPSAALMAKLALDKKPVEEAVRAIQNTFAVPVHTARSDYAQFCSRLDQLIRPDGACPIHELDLETIPPFTSQPSAPYRMDLAVTYRCNNDCSHCYNARPRNYPEMDTARWRQVIDRIWSIGIPHVVFTGGEPTLRSDLPELVQHAQQTGLVTGLNTNGRRLSDRRFVDQLVEAGLDHVQITLESHQPAIHNQMVKASNAWDQTVEGIRNTLDTPLYVMTNTTMLQSNVAFLGETLHFLADLGVPTVGLNALIYSGAGATCGLGLKESELTPLLGLARQITDERGLRLIWYTPTQYCSFDPMELELGVKGCTAALYNMCIEPDGAVLPCQSYYQSLGNILDDPWDSIWNHDLADGLRQRRFKAAKCEACVLLSECGGGCPLTIQTG